jgi:DNA-binding IclR family transcriptional regulator
LECFIAQETELSLNQISQQTGHYKSRIHRLCGTLTALGYLARTSRSNYRLGPKVMVLGKAYERTNTLKLIAAPVMKELSKKTELSSTLWVINGTQCLCLARETGPARFVYAINEGDFEELYTTAAGRVLLAYSNPKLAKKVLESAHPERFTPHTMTDVHQIAAELSSIQKRGSAFNDQEREIGISAISVPVFDHEKKITAALALVGLAHRFRDDVYQKHCRELKAAAEQISYRLGES